MTEEKVINKYPRKGGLRSKESGSHPYSKDNSTGIKINSRNRARGVFSTFQQEREKEVLEKREKKKKGGGDGNVNTV